MSNLERDSDPLAFQQLSSPESSVFYRSEVDVQPAAEWVTNANSRLDIRYIMLDAERMRSTSGLFDEFSSQLQFPGFFGNNWNALSDCLRDLEWLPAAGWVLVVLNSTHLLSDAEKEQMEFFVRVIHQVADEWSEDVQGEGEWDHSPQPFKVVFQYSPGHFAEFERMFARSSETFPPLLGRPNGFSTRLLNS